MNAIRLFCLCVTAGLCAAGVAGEPKASAPKSADAAKAEPTYEKFTEVKVDGPGGLKLQTLCADAQGRILGLVAQPRYFDANAKSASAKSEVHVLTPDGKPVKKWKVDFLAQSINVGPDGTVFVAGDGQVARFDPDGKALGQVELPHIADLLKNKEKMRADAEKQLQQQRDQFDKIKKQFTEQKEKL